MFVGYALQLTLFTVSTRRCDPSMDIDEYPSIHHRFLWVGLGPGNPCGCAIFPTQAQRTIAAAIANTDRHRYPTPVVINPPLLVVIPPSPPLLVTPLQLVAVVVPPVRQLVKTRPLLVVKSSLTTPLLVVGPPSSRPTHRHPPRSSPRTHY